MTRPDKVELAGKLHDRAVDRPAIVCGLQLADHLVCALRILGIGGAQDVHAVICVLAVVGGKVDVPAGVVFTDFVRREGVDLGRPVLFLRVGDVGLTALEHLDLIVVEAGEDHLTACRHADAVAVAVGDVVHAVFFKDEGVGRVADHPGKVRGLGVLFRRREVV